MPDTEGPHGTGEECGAKTTVRIGRHTEADVICGKEEHDAEEAHVARQETSTTEGGNARILYVWR